METRAEKFYGSFTGACQDRFVENMALLCARYEHHVANRHEVAQRYAEFGVGDFEDSFFPFIDTHTLIFFILLSARKAVAATLVNIRATRKPYKAAVTVLSQEGSFASPTLQAQITAEWSEVQEPELFLFSTLQPSAKAQIADWPRNWRPGLVTWESRLWIFPWNSRLWEFTRDVVNGSFAKEKDWHKFDWWQEMEDLLRKGLLFRGLTERKAIRLIGLTWEHFFPEKMEGKYMHDAMRQRWRSEQKK